MWMRKARRRRIERVLDDPYTFGVGPISATWRPCHGRAGDTVGRPRGGRNQPMILVEGSHIDNAGLSD